MKKLIYILILLLLSSSVYAQFPTDDIRYFILDSRNTTDNTISYNGIQTVTEKIYYVASGGSAQYTQTSSYNINNGTWIGILNNTKVDKLQTLYIDIAVGSDPSFTPRIKVTSSPQAQTAKNITDINFELITYAGKLGIENLSIGSVGQVIKMVGGVPTWDTDNTGSNNYATSITVTGTTTKNITIARSGLASISALFTDLNSNNTYTHLSNFTDDIGVSADYDSLSDLQTAVSNDYHNLGGTDIDTFNSSDDFSTYFVNRSDWTTIDNYPAACSAGDFVTTIGDTLTCATPSYTVDTDTFNSTQEMIDAVNQSGQLSVNISCTDIVGGTDTDYCTDATSAGITDTNCNATGSCSDNGVVYLDHINYGNLNLGNYNLTNVNSIKFNISGCDDSTTAGDICWNSDLSTLNIVTGLGNIVQVGQELTSTVKNKAGQIIYAGQMVYINGSLGEVPTVLLADAANINKMHRLGMVTVPSCNDNADCQITYIGEVHDLDTSAYSEGTELYLSASELGNVTSTPPLFPNFVIHIGTVLRSHASTGIILFAPEIDMGDGVTINKLGVRTNLTIAELTSCDTIDTDINGFLSCGTDADTTYTADEDWINLITNTFTFNSSKLATIYYSASASVAVTGTITAGTLDNTSHNDGDYDSITLNITEQVASPALDLRVNFTDVVNFNNGIIRYRTSAVIFGDTPIIQVWNYIDSVWEDYPPLAESPTFAVISEPVFDDTEHIQNGIVQMRLYKATTGNTNNKYYVDWLALAEGFGTPSGQEVDPYSWHRNNNDSGNFNTFGNVSANNFYADAFYDNGVLLIDTDTNTQNTTEDVINAINISTYGYYFMYLKLDDWTNVTITESQISDLTHTVDTNTQNTTEDIQAVAVGGEVSGTVGSITLSDSALDDNYIELGDSFGGDVTGTYNAIVIVDNSSRLACGNITGATSDLCTLVDTDTDTFNSSADFNGFYLNVDGDTATENMVFQKNITTELINLESDPTNHRIYDNTTCIIITGDTSILSIC